MHNPAGCGIVSNMTTAKQSKMVAVRLDERTAKEFKVLMAKEGTTVQSYLANYVAASVESAERLAGRREVASGRKRR